MTLMCVTVKSAWMKVLFIQLYTVSPEKAVYGKVVHYSHSRSSTLVSLKLVPNESQYVTSY